MRKIFSILFLIITVLSGCQRISDTEINVVSREDGSGTRGAFIELFGIIEKDGDTLKIDHTTKEAIITNKTDVMINNVLSNKNAIGYISMGSVNNQIKTININSFKATNENIINGNYEIARPFIIVTKDNPNGIAKDFINFIFSNEGQEIINKDYIAINGSFENFITSNVNEKLVISGSSSVAPVMEKLKEGYEKFNLNGEIEIQINDSSTGITNTIEGVSNIGMSSRDLQDDEKEVLEEFKIALDGIVIIVNKENPINNLSKEEVKKIFTGDILNWNEISLD